jgi:dihydroflavonol-4-reductase
LLAEQHDVRVLVRPESDRRNLEGLPVDVVVGDLTDRASIEQAMGGCEAVFHVAADYRLWVPQPDDIYAANVDGTRNVMIAAGERGVRRVVYTSSVATLGFRADGSFADEATPSTLGDMIGHYKRSKFLAEVEVGRLVRLSGLPIVTVNPSTPIGPRDVKPTPTGRMIVEAATGRMPAFVETGLNLVHVDDVARGHLLAFEYGRIGERYVLGGMNASLRSILERIATLVGRRPPRVRLPHDAVMPIAHMAEAWARMFGREPFVTKDSVRMARKHMYFSSAKAEAELGFRARPIEEALRDAIDWFRAHGYLS